jgi:hypothetical protein
LALVARLAQVMHLGLMALQKVVKAATQFFLVLLLLVAVVEVTITQVNQERLVVQAVAVVKVLLDTNQTAVAQVTKVGMTQPKVLMAEALAHTEAVVVAQPIMAHHQMAVLAQLHHLLVLK